MHAPNDFLTDKTWFKSLASMVRATSVTQWSVYIYIYIYICIYISISIPTLNFLFWGWCHNLRPEWASYLKFLPSVEVYVKLLSTKFQPPSSSGSGVRRGRKVPKWAKTSKLLYLRCWQAGPLFQEKFLGGWDGVTFALASAVTITVVGLLQLVDSSVLASCAS